MPLSVCRGHSITCRRTARSQDMYTRSRQANSLTLSPAIKASRVSYGILPSRKTRRRTHISKSQHTLGAAAAPVYAAVSHHTTHTCTAAAYRACQSWVGSSAAPRYSGRRRDTLLALRYDRQYEALHMI